MPAESVIERLRRLEKEATKGPWHSGMACAPDEHPENWDKYSAIEQDSTGAILDGFECVADSDAALIVAMRNALPLLLRVAEAAERMTPGSDNWAWSDSMMADLHEAVRALRAGGSDV